MRIVGKTDDNQLVVADLGILYFQQGIPPSVIFDFLKVRGIVPSFQHFYDELKSNGMNSERIMHLLNEHVFEAYGKEYRDTIINRIKK